MPSSLRDNPGRLQRYRAIQQNTKALMKAARGTAVSEEAERARDDFVGFRAYVCQHETWDHHQRWIDILHTGNRTPVLRDVGGPNTLILAPRGSSKSTLLVEWIAWQIGRHIDAGFPIKIMIVSYNSETARAKLDQVKNILKTPRYMEVFPRVRKGRIWGATFFDIDRKVAGIKSTDENYTVAATGLTGTVTGRRSHLVVLDDVVKSPADIENPEIRRKMRETWTRVLLPTMRDGARAICLGTRMTAEDIYATTLNEANGWNVVQEQALIQDERGREFSYCPQLFSCDYLKAVRDQDPDGFEMQFQNRIPPSLDMRFKDSWLQYGPPPDKFDELAIGLDLSASLKETADYTVAVLVGRVGDSYWILDMIRGRWSGNRSKCDLLLLLSIDWGVLDCEVNFDLDAQGAPVWERPLQLGDLWPTDGTVISVYADDAAYQLSFRGDFENYIEDGLGVATLAIRPSRRKGDKLMRLRSVSGLFQSRRVFLNHYRDLSRLEYELRNAGQTDHDDAMDACVYALLGLSANRLLDFV